MIKFNFEATNIQKTGNDFLFSRESPQSLMPALSPLRGSTRRAGG